MKKNTNNFRFITHIRLTSLALFFRCVGPSIIMSSSSATERMVPPPVAYAPALLILSPSGGCVLTIARLGLFKLIKQFKLHVSRILI